MKHETMIEAINKQLLETEFRLKNMHIEYNRLEAEYDENHDRWKKIEIKLRVQNADLREEIGGIKKRINDLIRYVTAMKSAEYALAVQFGEDNMQNTVHAKVYDALHNVMEKIKNLH